jgi:hypothetical protein
VTTANSLPNSSPPEDTSVRQAGDSRLAIIRRIYFYLVAFVSFTAGIIAFNNLLGVVLDAWLGQNLALLSAGETTFARNTMASSAGMLIIATPIFLIHWAWIQGMLARQTRSDAGSDRDPELVDERASAWRKLFLYAAIGVGLVVAATRLFSVLSISIDLLLGVSVAGETGFVGWPVGWLHNLLMVGAGLMTLRYFAHQAVLDQDLGQEVELAGSVRRLFQLGVGLISLGVMISGGASVLERLLYALLSRMDSASLLSVEGGGEWLILSGGTASLLVGALLWRINWLRWQRLIQHNQAESRTVLRRLFFYAATVISAGVTLTPIAGLLNDMLRRLFGIATDSQLVDLAGPLALIPIGVIAWRWHWIQVNREADQYGNSPESANVRRVYYYLVSAVGLVLLWIGLVEIVRGLLDWLLLNGPATDFGDFVGVQLANGLSFLAVGAPVWAIHWRAVQRVALGTDNDARRERRSGPRRAYLYGVALVGALLILFELAIVLYRLLLWLLGDPSPDLAGSQTLDALVRSVTAAIFWAVHLLALRRDGQHDDKAILALEAEAQDADALDERRAALRQRITRLEAELSQAKTELAGLE